MVFEYILKKHGMDPKTDLSIDQSINFRADRSCIYQR